MPELPDVEVFRRYIQSTSLKKKIEDVEVKDERILEGIDELELEDVLEEEFTDTRRIGKHCFLKAGDKWIVFHFGMTGFVSYYKENDPDHVKVRFGFEDGYNLSYVCTRILGKVTLTEDPDDYAEKNNVGPDIMDLEKEDFVNKLSSKRGQVKSALMDQSLMSGLGNIYTDEVLFQMGIHPKKEVSDLDEDTIGRIRDKTVDVLEKSIDASADPEKMPDYFLIPRRKEGESCPKDGAGIDKIRVNNRSTYLCPKHQRMN